MRVAQREVHITLLASSLLRLEKIGEEAETGNLRDGVGWGRVVAERRGSNIEKNQPSLKAKPDGLQDEAGLIFAVVGVRWWYDEAFLRCAERHVTSCFTTTCLLYTSPPPAT